MRKVVVVTVLAMLMVVGGWLLLRDEASRAGTEARGSEPRAAAVEVERDRPSAAEAEARAEPRASTPPSRARSKAEREAMRRRILEAMQAREGAAGREGGGTKEGADGAGKAGEPGPEAPELKRRPDDEAPAPGNLIDRTGNHGHLVKVMNEDLMPLVDECYALARETQPELTGLLVLDVEMIGDADLGGVIESAVLGKENELVDPALVECVQESLLSVTLPPPPEGGKDAIQLQMRLEPEG